MEISDWITLGAIIVALGIGVSSLVQMQRLQKRERKERLLNEIIEWATDIAECGIAPNTPEIEIEDVGEKEIFYFLSSQTKKLDILQLLRARSVAVGNIAHEIGSSLREAVDDATNNLRNQIRCLYGFKITEELMGIREVVKNNKLLYDSAVKVFEEATKIKTRNIGKKEENMSKEDEPTGSNKLTLEYIEDHLKRQDRRMKKGTYLTGAAFGAAIALVGISLNVQMSFQFSPYVYIWFFIVIGLGFMCWCWWKQSKVK